MGRADREEGARSRARDAAWSLACSAAAVLAVGSLLAATGRLLLFPSLGPTAVMQAHEPASPSSRPYNVVVSHLLGLGTGLAAVFLLGIGRAPSVFAVGHVSWRRAVAAALAVGLAALLEVLLRATHPPAANTTLLVALGSFHAGDAWWRPACWRWPRPARRCAACACGAWPAGGCTGRARARVITG